MRQTVMFVPHFKINLNQKLVFSNMNHVMTYVMYSRDVKNG